MVAMGTSMGTNTGMVKNASRLSLKYTYKECKR